MQMDRMRISGRQINMRYVRRLILLAAIAASPLYMSAAVILPTGNFECFPCNPASIGTQQLPAVNGLAGVKFFTKLPIILGQDDGFAGIFMGAFGENLELPLPGTVIPVSYQMNLSTTGSVVIHEWELGFEVYGEDEEEEFLVEGIVFFSGAGAGNFSGSGDLTLEGDNILIPGLLYAEVGLFISFSGVGDIILDAPHSFNVGAVNDPGAAVPEPSSIALAASGALFMAVTCYRRKRTSTAASQ